MIGSGLRRIWIDCILCLLLLIIPTGCYSSRPSDGGAQARFHQPRRVDARDVQVPRGYRIDVVTTGLTFPTGIAFDDDGRPYVTESGYAYGEKWLPARLVLPKPPIAATRTQSRGLPVSHHSIIPSMWLL